MPQVRFPHASVGQGGANRPADVRLVQWLLNAWLRSRGATLLAVDGIAGPLTVGAIHAFQQQEHTASDDRVDPGGPTIKALVRRYFGDIRKALPLYESYDATQTGVPPLPLDELPHDLAALFEATDQYRASRPSAPSRPLPRPPNMA